MSRAPFLALVCLALVSCEAGAPPEPENRKREPAAVETASAPVERAKVERQATPPTPPAPSARTVEAKPVAEVPVSADDPLKGKFTLEDATKGLPGKGKLVAEIKTSKGSLSCELWDDKAPITVANFVGLARGLRPWKTPEGKWEKKPLYDGTPFHRVIKGFMVQGGDPKGTGQGEPGYVIPDEIWEGAHHDQRGLICMANRGANTNGSQFFIMDGAAPHLDGGYTIFGKCSPDEVIQAIASTPVTGDRAMDPVKIEKVIVKRAK